MTGSVIDQSVLASLRQLERDTDEDLLGELIELFFEDAPARLKCLRGALAQGDANGFMRAAHSLKGSSGNLGARGMAALCADLEQRARSGTLDGVEAIVATLEKEFELVRRALEQERRACDGSAPPLAEKGSGPES